MLGARMCLLLLSIYPFFLTSSPSTVESSFLSSMKPLVSPCILSTSYPSFLISYFLPVYLLSISCLSLSVSLHTFLSPLPPLQYVSPNPPSQSSCLPSVHSVICTVSDAVPAPSLSTVSPLCLQNSII